MSTYINPKAIENKSITKDKLSDDLIFDIKGEIPKNEIWYTSSDGMVEPNDSSAFPGSIISNTYKNGKYIIKFDAPVTSIGNGAFHDCNHLTSVRIPDGVTSIGEAAFYNCNEMGSITIPNSVTSIGLNAFRDCSSLTSVTIPDSVTSIGEWAFYGCTSLTSVTIGNGVTSIGEGAFSNCSSLESVTIGNGVTSIGEGAFSNCECLISIEIPDSVTSIGRYAFYVCWHLTSATIPDSVTSIGDCAFEYCSSLTSVKIGNGVTEIGMYAFRSCTSLTSITIPDSVTSIGEGAFEYCISLKSITIGKGVTYIGYMVFYECVSLGNIYCKTIIPPPLEDYDSYIENSKIHVHINSLDAYKNASNWSDYADNMVGVVFEDEHLISGQNIKTINGTSIIGEGNISISIDMDNMGGVDADTLDGKHASAFAAVNHTHDRFNSNLVHFDGAIHICNYSAIEDNDGGSDDGMDEEYGRITGIYFSDAVEEDIYESAYAFIREEGDDRLRVHSNYELTLSTGGSAYGNGLGEIYGPYINLVHGGDMDEDESIFINANSVYITGGVTINDIITSLGKIYAVGGINITGNATATGTITSTGKIYAQGGIDITGDATATGTMTSAGFYQSSDERLKTFTSDYDIDLDDIKNIKTGKFYWNSDENQVINGGVSAQTVEQYFPELVKEDETGMKSVNYDGLAVVAIAAIKKLTDRIEQLEEIVRNK